MKYNNIQVSNFEFYSLTNNNRNVLNSKLSPFDNDDYNYRNSIFQNKYKTTLPKRGDLLLNIYSYSLKNENSCNFWKTSGYKKIFSSTMSFVNTLTSNLIKVLFYKNEFRKEHYLKKFGYEIFEIE